ncbi:MAG: 50S ribosomal protein L13 [Methanobacteriaceae archaeon]|jgi:ribosomal protein uL13|nr:50S ribosomal protein L13 [Methanobacteriaceae archaeon]
MIIDGDGHIMGRLASVVSKKLLDGENVVVLNAEKIIITGSKEWAYARYKQRLDRASISNPRKMGPKFPKRPDDIFRRTVRGMLPYKKPTGRKAYKSLKAFVGIPREFSDIETSNVPEAQAKHIKKNTDLGEISKLLGAKF